MRISLILLLISCNVLLGQVNLKQFDYTRADSVALHFPKRKYKSYTEIVFPLTEKLPTEQEKFRAIFRWITDNISYSFSNRTSDPEKVIKRGKAVCSGYASLLEAMCKAIGIQCEVITGYSKTTSSDIGKPLDKTDHAWNAVKLNNSWHLVDVTWAWGYRNQRGKFVKQYDNTYFLADHVFFNKKHYPAEKQWFLTEEKMRKSDFKRGPVFHENYLDDQIELISPKKGIIKIRLKDSLKLEFTSQQEVDRITYIVAADKFAKRMSLRKMLSTNGDIKYTATTKFERKTEAVLAVFINGKHTLSYRLVVK